MCTLSPVAARQRPRDRALDEVARDLLRSGHEIRSARRSSGISIRAAAASVGLDPSTYGRLERGRLPHLRIDQLALAAASVGQRLSVRTFLVGEPVRDAGHLRLLARLRARLPVDVPLAFEVPLPIPGDLRAIDAWTSIDGRSVGFEAETRLGDLQALERRALLKRRDARLHRLVLVIADTRANREVLAVHRESMRSRFPLDTRAILTAFAEHRAPGADGIVIL